MGVKHRIAAPYGRDGADDGIDPGKRGSGIVERVVIGKFVNLPARRGFFGQFRRGAGGAAHLPSGGGKPVAKRPADIAKSEDENAACHGTVSGLLRYPV